jgi:uncharacterized protein (TIGR02996 family)
MGQMLDAATDTAFLRTILADPDDDAPRLIYADWLDEQGDADRAEFIRLQIRLARMESDEPGHAGIRRRAHELGRAHHVEWTNQLPRFEHVNWEVFERGFISAVKFESPEAYFQHAHDVFDAAPIQELRLHQFYWRDAARLAESPYLRRVRVLDLNDGNRIGIAGAESLMSSPHLRNLVVLKMGKNSLGSAAIRAICQANYVRKLRILRLERNDLFDDGLTYIAESSALARLQQLDLSRTRTGDGAVKKLAASKKVSILRWLDLSHNQLTDESLVALAGSPNVAEVRDLYLHGNAITDAGVLALAESAYFGNLERVFLHSNQVRDRGAEALARSPLLPNLREVFIGNRITNHGARVLLARFGDGANVDQTSF